MIAFLVVGPLLTGANVVYGHYLSWQMVAGAHVTKTTTETEAYEARLDQWLAEHGFVEEVFPNTPAITRSFRGGYKDSPTFTFQVTREPRLDVRPGWNVFHFSHTWEVGGRQSKIEHAKELSDQFTTELLAWSGA